MNLDRSTPTSTSDRPSLRRARPVGTEDTVVDRDRPAVDDGDRRPDDEPVDRPVDERDRPAVDERDRPVTDERVTDERVTEPVVVDRRTVLAREREAFGGVKIGSAFFGWLTATGTAVLLTAFVSAGGTAVGVLAGDPVSRPDFGVTWRGVRGATLVIAVLLVAYFCGGYVAGRMARFNGLRQGLAVFVWAVVVALVVTALGALAGTRWETLSSVTGVPRFGAGPTRVTADGMLVGLLAAAGALVGSLLGGLAGMRYHRRVDRAGWVTTD